MDVIFVSNYEELWNKILDEIERVFDAETFNDVFKSCEPYQIKNNYLEIIAPTQYIKNKLNKLYIDKINSILLDINNGELIKAKILLRDEIKKEITITTPENLTNKYRKNLNANYNFNNFVVGQSNMFAFRMAMKIADQPGVVGNPFYIFGNVGLGKTHLMESIGNYILDNDIHKNILYVKASEFIEDYSKMCSGQITAANYEEKYRNIDVLLIDDIQMLELGKKSQEEFFKIFDILYNDNKQIVITSDRPAKNLNIMDRLTSRFEVGLTVDIQTPNFEHRIDIVKKKFENNGKENIDLEILEFIAKNFTSNVREIEGAVNRLCNYVDALNLNLNLDVTKEALSVLIDKSKLNKPTDNDSYNNLIGIVADFYSITADEITGTKRNGNIVFARQLAMCILKREYGLAYKKIGGLFGGKDHSTVMSSVEKIEKELEEKAEVKMAYETIIKKIK